MKRIKVFLTLLLTFSLLLALAACGSRESSKETTAENVTETTAETTTTTEHTTSATTATEATTAASEAEGSIDNDKGTVVYSLNCDSADGWSTDVGEGKYGPFLNVGSIDTENKREGEGCLDIKCDDTTAVGAFLAPSAVFQWSGTPIETGLDRENGAIRLNIYVSSPAVVKLASKIQIGSAGIPDADEYEFIFGNSDDQTVCTHPQILEKGWNEITLNLSDAWKVGEPDLNAINFIKFYALVVPEKSEVEIDNIRFVNIGE